MSNRKVTFQQTIAYEVVNTSNIFHPQNWALLSTGKIEDARRFVVVDANVEKHHAKALRDYFAHHHIEAKIVVFPGGEENKTLDHYLSLVRELDSFPIHRRDEPIIAIGGGVLTDLVGFVAASYRRGVPYVKVPTTLMGYVDASIGIKTGFNFNGNKNRLGSFHAPQTVLLDKAFLKTLPRRHILNGVCEIVKLAVIKDAPLFDLLEARGPQSVEERFQNEGSGDLLDRAIAGMIEELEPNLFEEDLARKVDFGHTFSYGLETRHEAHLLHGEAVLLDILLSCLIARNRNLLADEETRRIFRLTETLGFELDASTLDPDLLLASLTERTYHRNGLQRVPMPRGIGGCVFLNNIGADEIESAAKTLKEWIAINHEII
ncbi:MAG: iron-containing alcohol dehydrogenase [Chloroflexi bacterium CFX1]|nr:iron-containing alcohol dehydrogenase [Chloroflexi bacterium CFX1]MDL1920124.1 sedoheptulose 7-phosphate cyclase [Chloroflexi bacterium CFX5]NUQ59392.1 sedoheptulose 7-phosphate cyclase [Anaerolineales bacterium]